jgi:hypothetical protein
VKLGVGAVIRFALRMVVINWFISEIAERGE